MSLDPSQVSLCLVTIGERERLWSKIEKGGPDDCWPYTGATNESGYGLFSLRRRSRLAHRVMDSIAHGPIPPGICVLHSCDNPPCCNPAHLFRGTRVDNNADMRAKGRHAPLPRPDLRGSRHPLARLTREAVLAIRSRAAEGEGVSALAREFGVSHSLISGVVSRRKWAWL